MAPSIDPLSARYARQRILPGLGETGQRRLTAAHAAVIGAGGLGSAVLPILTAAGVGTVTVIDDDLVDETNLHRQILHGPADIGRPKAESAADSLRSQSPQTTVTLQVPGCELVLRKGPDFAARSVGERGIQGTPAGLSVTGLLLDVKR